MANGIIICGDCVDVMKKIPDNSINCCVTSPPYYGLRDYQTAKWEGGDINCSHKRDSKKSLCHETGSDDVIGGIGDAIYKNLCFKCGAVRIDKQIGLEETPDKYIEKLVMVFREVKRVLKDDGCLWLNLGDTYSSHKDCKSVSDSLRVGGKSGQANVIEKGLSHSRNTKMLKSVGLKNKDLIGIPWMVAFALRNDGWYLRQDIIYHKRNPMPESVTDRCTKSHEYIFLLSKSQKYYFDYKSIREKAEYDGRKDTIMKGSDKYKTSVVPNKKEHIMAARGHERWQQDEEGNYLRNKRSVWTISVKPFRTAHFAVFPEALIEPCLLSSCPVGGVVLDPFIGSGTTAIVAIKQNKRYIGIDLNPKYCEIARKRIDMIKLPVLRERP